MGPGGGFTGNPDAARSFVERVLSFPENVEVESILTYTGADPCRPDSTPAGPDLDDYPRGVDVAQILK